MKVIFSENATSDFRHKNNRLIGDQLCHMLACQLQIWATFYPPERYIQYLTALQLLQGHISSQSTTNYLSGTEITSARYSVHFKCCEDWAI